MNEPQSTAPPPAKAESLMANSSAGFVNNLLDAALATGTEPASPAETAEVVALPWAEVKPEKLNIVRLAPLPPDRQTGLRPLRFVQVGRAERHGKMVSLLRLEIQLPGQRVHKNQNRLDVWVNHAQREIRIEPPCGLMVEPANRGLGRFLLAHAVLWLQSRWPDYLLRGHALASKDAPDEPARLRRDHALRMQGLDVEYVDNHLAKARYKPAKVSDLLGVWNIDKVQAVDTLDAAAMLQQADQSLQDQEIRLHRQEEVVAKYQRNDSNLRFTITCLIAFTMFQAGLLIWMASR